MAIMRYYYPDGNLIGQDKSEEEQKCLFIDFYSRFYYYLNRNIKLERNVENILQDTAKGKVIEKEALEEILNWKVDTRYYTFKKENSQKTLIPLDEILDITKNINVDITEGDIQDILEKLLSITGIGAVYAIAILYFCTGGEKIPYLR